jgi:hypothetical protein
MLFPDAPYSALWSQPTCHRQSQISAILCLADFGFIIWLLYRRKRDTKFNIFQFGGIPFNACRLVGDLIDLRYFFHLAHDAAHHQGWEWCLFILVFVVRIVLILVCPWWLFHETEDNMKEFEETLSQGHVLGMFWFFWTFICMIGSRGLWMALGSSLMIYNFIISFANRLVFVLFSV